MNIQEFIDNVSDKVVDYLRENKTQDMQEVKNIISLHFSDGLIKAFYNEDEEIVNEMERLTREKVSVYSSSKRNAEINARLMKLAQRRKAIRINSAEARDAKTLVRMIRFLKANAPLVLAAFYEQEPKEKPFKKVIV